MLDLPQKPELNSIVVPLPRREEAAKDVLSGYEAYFSAAPAAGKSAPELTPLELMYAYYDAA